jgi:hypothetical protein
MDLLTDRRGMGEMRPRRHLLLLALLSVNLVFGPARGADAASPTDEFEVKAAFLNHFSTLVEWPTGAFGESEEPAAVCVLGDDPFGAYLDRAFEARRVDGRTVEIRRFADSEAARSCHVLFVASSERSRVAEVHRRLAGRSILTVSDMRGYAVSGGMIQLKLDGGRVRFDINLTAVQDANLKVSSKLLRLATTIHGSPGER